jgi:hypothetical protein
VTATRLEAAPTKLERLAQIQVERDKARGEVMRLTGQRDVLAASNKSSSKTPAGRS